MDCKPKRNCQCSQNSICEFLQSLEPFTKVESIVIAGKESVVSYFLSFNKMKGIVSFVQEDNDVIFVDCSKIDAVRIGKVCNCKAKVKFIEEDFSLLGNVCPQCLTEGSTLFFDFYNSELNLSLQAKTIDAPRCIEFTDELGNVVKQITIVGEAIVSKDFVQVPELLDFRLILSDMATNPLNFGLLFINFPDITFIILFASSGYLNISNCLKIESGTGNVEIEEMKKMVTNDSNTYKSIIKLTKIYKNGATESFISKKEI
ncbi:BC_2878 family exosporium-associated protein [Bacillus nitratireducens]|uniref:BC_2878 family exosporium-associated protein n=1 Tax=Bacillus nitratireducens TaxID=2026193 RepID=UPI0039BFDE5A